jgi:hypothetical protein
MSNTRAEVGVPRTAAAVLLVVFASLAISACGGTSATGTSVTAGSVSTAARGAGAAASTASSTTSTGHGASPARSSASAGAAQFKQALSTFAACLKSGGVKLPSTNGAQGLSLKGVDTKSPEYRSAVAKCRGVLTAALKSASKAHSTPATPSRTASAPGAPTATAPASPAAPANIPVKVPAHVTAVMDRFTACMRENGVPGFPKPKGASFDLTGTSVNASTPQYKAAQTKCNPILNAMIPKG